MPEVPANLLQQCQNLLDACMLRDRAAGLRALKKIHHRARAGESIEADAGRLLARLQQSASRAHQRQQSVPAVTYPAELPVSQKIEDIGQLIAAHQVVIVCGETGSGKTTQLPKLCLQLGRGVRGLIGHTQPRRLAASSVANRIAEELKLPLGEQVGYKVRFSDKLGEQSLIKLMTDGILLAEIHHDPHLNQYDTLIIDEAHERSLNIDFLLGYLKRLLPKRPDLKIIITSATIDPQRFSKHFDNAPIIEVSGRSYPVEIFYQPLYSDDEDQHQKDLQQGVGDAVRELLQFGDGDVLVFLSGERAIRDCAEHLQGMTLRDVEILPLLSRLSASEQNRIFHPGGHRRVVLATNIAETSLTVPGIKYVVDSGEARISRYSWRARMQRLPIEPISRASANQRAGRCGRTSPGVCIRLYAEDEFNLRPEFTEPEIQRTNLASVILQMEHMQLGHVDDFPFVEPPDSRLVGDGYKLLFELGAINEFNEITAIGKKLARLPIDPKLGRMLLEAERESALNEVLVIVSALAIQDPRERPLDKQGAAYAAHKSFADNRSDFMAFLNIWNTYHKQQQKLSSNKLRQWCREHFLSWMRLREWRDTHEQINKMLHELGVRFNQQAADYNAIHRSLLTGLLGNLGSKQEDREYLGARNRKFLMFPGSGLFSAQPKWLMAAEIVETTKVYARTLAKIDPQWIEHKATHLLKHSYSSPHWEKKAAQVAALENTTLYGLLIHAQRKVNYGPIDPKISRELFIRAALVQGEFESSADFFVKNRALIDELENLEAKSRRQDIVVDDEVLYQFYDERIPEGMYSGAQFEVWLKALDKPALQKLYWQRETLMQHDAKHVTSFQYPDHVHCNGIDFPLQYHFDPGQHCDGITLITPLAALDTVNAARCEWLVPGMLQEKITGLIRSLPKNLRRHFVPAPNFAEACVQALQASDMALTTALANHLKKISGVDIPFDAWRLELLDKHLLMNFRVLDDNGKILVEDRDLQAIKNKLAGRVAPAPVQKHDTSLERDDVGPDVLDHLPEKITRNVQGIQIAGYPALSVEGKKVALRVFNSPQQAKDHQRAGLRQLFVNALPDQIRHAQANMPDINKLCLQYAPLGQCAALKQDIILACIERVFMQTPINSRKMFDEALQQGRGNLFDCVKETCKLLGKILDEYQPLNKMLKNPPLHWLDTLKDVQQQLQQLLPPGFLLTTPRDWLEQYPRYLKAIARRLDKINENPARERTQRLEMIELWNAYHKRAAQLHAQGGVSSQLEHYRWLLEEYRVSLFAQELKTREPVSAKRLKEFWNNISDA